MPQAAENVNDLEAEVVVLPEVPAATMSLEIVQHHARFEASLGTMLHVGEYGWQEEDRAGMYVVFSYPLKQSSAPAPKRAQMAMPELDDNFSRVVSLHGSSVSLEWIAYDSATDSHLDGYAEYFENLRRGLLGDERLPWVRRDDDKPGVLFIKPATDFDLQQEVKLKHGALDDEVALVLWTRAPDCTRNLLEKGEGRDLLVHGPEERPRYFARFEIGAEDWSDGPSLHLEAVRRGMGTNSSLTSSSHARQSGSEAEMFVKTSSKLIVLVDHLGSKAIDVLMTNRLVQRRSPNFMTVLETAPGRC